MVKVSSNQQGIALNSPAGSIAIAWTDVQAMLEDIRQHQSRQAGAAHLGSHADMSAALLKASKG
jgi:hypothetical protein